MRKLLLSTPARFLLAGMIAAAANLGSRWLIDLALPFAVAVVLAFCVGLVTAFTLMRRFVFPPAGTSTTQQFGRFVLVNLAALVQTLAVSYGLYWALGRFGSGFMFEYRDDIAHLFGVAVPILTSYVAHRRYTFKREQTELSHG